MDENIYQEMTSIELCDW